MMTRKLKETFDPSPPRPDFSYCQPGIYFATICVKNHRMMLGTIKHSSMCLSQAGLFVQKSWESLPERFPFVELDMHVIMPNHFHGLISIKECPQIYQPPPEGYPLGEVIRQLKGLATYSAHKAGIAEFEWQKRYWIAVMSNEEHLYNVRRYIFNNPAQWTVDRLYRAETRALNAPIAYKQAKNHAEAFPLDELPF